MKKKFFLWFLVLIVATLFYTKESYSSPAVKPTDIDSLLKKVELIPVMINGDKDNRINIVIMNRWSSRDKEPYNSPAMKQEFLKDIEESFIAAITPGDSRAQTVFANYRQFFNVYGLWWPDMPEWGKGVDQKGYPPRIFILPW
jgi:hypothetical protein